MPLPDMLSTPDLKILPWVPTGRGDLEKRSFSYTKPLNGTVGPSSTTCYITDEELLKDPERCYEVLSITKTPDVPSGGSFEVQTKTCLTWAGGPKSGCQMVVTTECVWSGRSMIKGECDVLALLYLACASFLSSVLCCARTVIEWGSTVRPVILASTRLVSSKFLLFSSSLNNQVS